MTVIERMNSVLESENIPWGYGVMDSIWDFESQDLGSTPGTPATLNKQQEEKT
jgi:hypothetical protein